MSEDKKDITESTVSAPSTTTGTDAVNKQQAAIAEIRELASKMARQLQIAHTAMCDYMEFSQQALKLSATPCSEMRALLRTWQYFGESTRGAMDAVVGLKCRFEQFDKYTAWERMLTAICELRDSPNEKIDKQTEQVMRQQCTKW